MKEKSDGIDRVLETPVQVHHPEEKFRDLMSIRLTRFPRYYVDNLPYLHGPEMDLDVDGEKRGRKASSRGEPYVSSVETGRRGHAG